MVAEGFRLMLLNLENDPEEYTDLREDPAHEAVRRSGIFCMIVPSGRFDNQVKASAQRLVNHRQAFLARLNKF
jgi:hypothetical protein